MSNIREVVKILNQIKSISSKNEKESIIRANKNNELFREVLDFLYNPFVLTGLKFKKMVKFVDFTSDDVLQLDTVQDAMDYIKKNNTGRDEDIKVISNFINTFDTDVKSPVHDFLQEMFTKDFKCGITAKTINKAIIGFTGFEYGKGGFIPEFDVMLAEAFHKKMDKVKGEFYITEKLDGVRALCIKQNDSINFFTRQGKPIEGLEEITSQLKLFPDFVYDGELLLDNILNLPSDELYRETVKVTNKKGVKTGLIFHVFDGLPYDEFLEGKSHLPYEKRRLVLLDIFTKTKNELVKLLPTIYYGDSISEVLSLLDLVIEEGKEGLMLNTVNGYYVTKRTSNLLKVKKMYPIDLRVLRLEEGSGKNSGKLGAVVVDYKGYEVGVGSGFSDKQRVEFWNNPDKIVGRIIEMQYFEESSNQDGGISLRFPVFKRVRDDKDEVSYD